MAATIDIRDPNTGETQTVPAADEKVYLSSGFELDTPEARAARAEAEKYSTTGQQIATGAEGVARGASMGLSDMAETGLGIAEPEDIEARRQQNPGIAGTSEAAGLIGSLFVPGVGEAEGVMKGASLATALPRATEALGKGAGGLTKKILQGLGAAPEGIATKALSSAADLAAQSEVYNAAQQVDETHLAGGNMEQAAENIAASSGDALALDAGLGAAIPIAGLGVKLAASKAGQALAKVGAIVKDRLPSLGEGAVNAYAKVAGGISGAGEDAIKEDLAGAFTPEGAAMRERKLQGVTADERDKMQTEFQSSLKEAFDATQSAIKQGFKEFRPEETARLAHDVPIGPAAEDAAAIGQKMKETIGAMRAEPEIYSQGVARKLEIAAQGFADKLENKGIGSTGELFELMDDLKSKGLDPMAKFGGVISQPERDAIAKVRDLRAMVKNHLENVDNYGEAAARQAAFNDAYNEWRTLVGSPTKLGDFRRFFLDKAATKGGGFELQVSPTKVNTYLSKVGAARDVAHTQALNDFLTSSQKLVAELGRSADNSGLQNFDSKGMRSLLDTVQEQGTTNAARLQDAAKQRALANGPFVTSAPLNMVTKHGGLATAGAIIGGAPGALVGGMLSKGAELLTNPHEAMRALSMLEGVAMKTSSRIASGVKAGMKTGAELADRTVGRLRLLAAPEIGEKRDAAQSNRDMRKEYQREEKEQLQKAASAPNYQQHLAVHAPSVAAHAPKVTAAVAAQQKKIAAVINAALPRDPSPMPPLGRGNDWVPSRSEWQDYQRTKDIATNPMAAVEHFRDGQLTPEDVKTMTQLWPNVLGQMRREAAQAIEKAREPLTGRQIDQLSTLFAAPVDASQTPDFQAAVQGVWQKQAAAKAQQQASAASSADKFAQSFMTRSDKLAAK